MMSKVETLRCVIVDDNPGFLDAAAKFLGHHGITVVAVASTIDEAVTCVAQVRPDVTVVDINLGDESGFDLAEQLAGGPASPPVILTSTHSEQEFADMIAVSPAIGFVPKVELSPEAMRRLLAAGHDGTRPTQANGRPRRQPSSTSQRDIESVRLPVGFTDSSAG